MTSRKPGEKAPAFNLPRDGGGSVSLADFKGRKLVLYFYPKADTPGCTRRPSTSPSFEAAFAKAGTDVLGVSADPVKAQDKFNDKHDLTIALASDETHKCSRPMASGARNPCTAGSSWALRRTTFLIGRDGRIARIWPKVKVDGHAEEVLEAAKAL